MVRNSQPGLMRCRIVLHRQDVATKTHHRPPKCDKHHRTQILVALDKSTARERLALVYTLVYYFPLECFSGRRGFLQVAGKHEVMGT